MSAGSPRGTRRVVTGINAEGKSCVTIDGPLLELGAGGGARLAWRTDSVPADNSGTGDVPPAQFGFDLMHGGGTMFMVMEYAPGGPEFWHATDTLDYIVMLEGEVTLDLEAGPVTIRAGDVLVDRGVVHSWRNDSGKPARAAIVILPAHPVGKGRTM
jgi:quercetin dioxygenase-like cupin family protein